MTGNILISLPFKVTLHISSVLKATLTVEEKDFLDRIPTESLEAYEYYQKGNYYWYNFATRETNLKAAQMYEKAITQIEFLLSIPSQLTVWRLKLDPIYDPLRKNLKFRKIIDDHSE
jgi:hypothetical protein